MGRVNRDLEVGSGESLHPLLNLGIVRSYLCHYSKNLQEGMNFLFSSFYHDSGTVLSTKNKERSTAGRTSDLRLSPSPGTVPGEMTSVTP